MRKISEEEASRNLADMTDREIMKGYTNFVSMLKMFRKHRPLTGAENLPKVSQPEDHTDLHSPDGSSSEGENQETISVVNSEYDNISNFDR